MGRCENGLLSHDVLLFSCSVVSDPLHPRGLNAIRFLCPWDFPGKTTGVVAISFSGDLSDQGFERGSPTLASRFFTVEPPEKPLMIYAKG